MLTISNEVISIQYALAEIKRILNKQEKAKIDDQLKRLETVIHNLESLACQSIGQ